MLPFVGPPFGLPLWGALAHLPFPVARFVWGAVLVAAALAFAGTSLKLAGSRIAPRDALGTLALAAGFGPLTSALALGQVALVSCAAIAGAVLASRLRSTAGTFACALIAALQPNLALALLPGLRERRSGFALLGAAAVAAAISLRILGYPGAPNYLAILRDHANAENFIVIQTTPRAVAFALGAPGPAADALGIALALAVAAIASVQIFSRRYDNVAAAAIACAALPLALPFSHEADLALLFFPAVAGLRRSSGLALVAALAGTLLVAVNWLDAAQRTTSPLAVAGLVLCAAGGALALARPRLRPSSRAAFALVPACALLAVLAMWALSAAHPLPVWPDALPAHFQPPPFASAASIWNLEQRASGLAAPDAWSGMLRLLSLTGCALLWTSVATLREKPV